MKDRRWTEAITYISNEAHNSPNDSVVDICNEAFDMCGLDLTAQWSESQEGVILIHNAEAGRTEVRGSAQ